MEQDSQHPSPSGQTRAVEDYVKAIYTLQQEGGAVSTNALCVQLGGLKPGSVSGMLRRLAELGLVEHLPYHGVRLSSAGERAALALIRNHRLLETFLIKALGYSWDEVHAEAEKLEHHISPLLAERIARYLDHPATDPHGAPIPLPDGTLPAVCDQRLSNLPVGAQRTIARVSIHEPARLRYLGTLGLVPGASVEVVAYAPFEGPVTLRVAGTLHHLDRGLAQAIFVAP